MGHSGDISDGESSGGAGPLGGGTSGGGPAGAGVIEHGILDVDVARSAEFEAAFAEAKAFVARTEGFRRITMSRCHETPGRYLMLIEWDSIAAHLENFRGSDDFTRWRSLMNPFYAATPTIEHFVPFDGA